METQVWISLAIQAAGAAIMLGVFLQQHKEYARRIQLLEQEKLDREIHRLDVGRIDKDLERLNERLMRIEERRT